MTIFEYASGLISIVVALSIARVLGGLGAVLSTDRRTRADWIVGAWCVLLGLMMVSLWMRGWRVFREQTEISFSVLAVCMLITSLGYLSAYLLVPSPLARRPGEAEETGFRLPGRAFFACLALCNAVFIGADLVANRRFLPFAWAITLVTASGVFLRTQRAYEIQVAVFAILFLVVWIALTPALR